MSHRTSEPPHILDPADLEEIVEPCAPCAHLRGADSLLFDPGTFTENQHATATTAARTGSGVLALPDLVSAYRPARPAAEGLPSAFIVAPLRAPAPAPPRALLAAVAIASLALISAVALAAHASRGVPAPRIAEPAAPEPPRTSIAPLDERPSLSLPRFEVAPEAPPVVETEPAAPEPVVTAPVRRAPRAVSVMPPRAATTTPRARRCGDEIECLLADDSDTPFEPATAPEPDPLRPESLDSFTISRTMTAATRRADRCDDTYGSGTVKVRVTVGPDGAVAKVVISSSPSQPLAACVADAIRATDFPASRTGATFNYIFPFR
ncbi:MAG TPA: energy transducer TonB [Kofleriaceae bacterium]|nr:energy transducer TonB [Kofleriaceae bacterium]